MSSAPYVVAAVVSALGLAVALVLLASGPDAPRSGAPPAPGADDEPAIRAAVQRYYAALDAGRPGRARALLAGRARADVASGRDPFVAARVALGEIRPAGSSQRAEVEVRSLVTVRARSGCATARDGAVEVTRRAGTWRITDFVDPGTAAACDCASGPWRTLPTPGRPRPPELGGPLERVVATAAYASSAAAGLLRRPQAIDAAGNLAWTVPGSGVGFDVTFSLARTADVRCVSVAPAASGARPTLVTITSPGRTPTPLTLAPVPGVQWLKRDYGRTDDVTVHIDAVTRPSATRPPPLQVQVFARPRPAPDGR